MILQRELDKVPKDLRAYYYVSECFGIQWSEIG